MRKDILKDALEKFKKEGKSQISFAYIAEDDSKDFDYIGHNEVTFGGTQAQCKFMYGNRNNNGLVAINKLDVDLGIHHTVVTEYYNEIFGILFSTEGGDLGTQNAVRKHDKGYDLTKIIPHIIVNKADDNVTANMALYDVRVENADNTVSYYVKRPTSITMVGMTVDGEVLTDYPSTSLTRDVDTTSVIYIEVPINNMDFAEHFIKLGDINRRYYNSIAVLFGKKIDATVNSKTVSTHKDIIVTNKYHELPVELGKYQRNIKVIISAFFS